jgi:hypothetical protein
MKRLSAIALACAFLIGFTAMAFTGKPATILNHSNAVITKAAPAKASSRAPMYYWYWEPSDTYNDYNNLAGEEFEMWIYFDGVLVNTTPEGGTLVEEGYLNDGEPHTEFPYYYLYAHFN